jgi:hypothetical protein
MKAAVKIIMNGTNDELVDFIEATHKEFLELPVEAIAFPRGVNGIVKYGDAEEIYTKGTPLHVKAVLLYNNQVKKLGLQRKYPYISDGDKIKFVYLKDPNPIGDKAIAFPRILPPEFKAGNYIDYGHMWELTFESPLSKIVDPINWRTEKQYDMEAFFK